MSEDVTLVCLLSFSGFEFIWWLLIVWQFSFGQCRTACV